MRGIIGGRRSPPCHEFGIARNAGGAPFHISFIKPSTEQAIPQRVNIQALLHINEVGASVTVAKYAFDV